MRLGCLYDIHCTICYVYIHVLYVHCRSYYIMSHVHTHIYIYVYTAVAWGGCTYWPKTEDTFEDTWGLESRAEASKHGLRRNVGVSRHMPGENSEDAWASEDTFPAKTLVVAKTRGRPKTLPERAVLAKAFAGVMPCAREKTIAEDRSGEGTLYREDTWAYEDASRRQVLRGQAPS